MSDKENPAFYVWCEWICITCDQQHRIRFSAISNSHGVYRKKKRTYQFGHFRIIDRDRGGSKIYVRLEDTFTEIFEALESYLRKFCQVQEGSLKMSVCYEPQQQERLRL